MSIFLNFRYKLWEMMDNKIPNYLLNTIKYTYRNMKIRMKFNDSISEPIRINKGVWQGCGLSPVLFHIYILITSPNSNQLQSDLNTVFAQLNKWFKSNLLFFNFDKTHFIQFNNASKCTSVTEIKYEEEQISRANETKFLGLYINNTLSGKHTLKVFRIN